MVTFGPESIFFLAPKFKSIVPQEIQNCKSLDSFIKRIRKWKLTDRCRLCETYL